jgi:hypothetical protein
VGTDHHLHPYLYQTQQQILQRQKLVGILRMTIAIAHSFYRNMMAAVKN